MSRIKLSYYKCKWLYKYKKEILNKNNDYTSSTFSDIFQFDSNVNLYYVTFFDTVNNNEANKLIRKIYKLKSNNNYKVEISYRKKAIRNLNYIRPQFDHTGYGILGKVTLLNDDLLSSIEMIWAQINNDEALIEYKCYFKKSIDNFNQIHNYILDNYNKLYKLKYTIFYFDIKHFLNDKLQNIQTEEKYFRIIIQGKLQDLFFSHYIKKYLIPIKYTYVIDKKTKKIIEGIRKPFLEESFIIKNNHYLIFNSIEDFEGTEITEISFGNIINDLSIVTLLSRLRMPLYYKIFYNIERAELETRITKYLNSMKMSINFWDYKWLLNKKRRIDEQRFYENNNDDNNKIKGFSNKKNELIDMKLMNGIKSVYDENIEYIKNINSMNYNLLAFAISILALVIAIIGLFI